MNRLFVHLMAFTTIALTGCSSSRKSQNTNQSNQNISICDKTVKYVIEKFKMIEGGNEIKVHTEITFDPTNKIIGLKADDPENGPVSFNTEIESIDCNLNANLTEGQALYKGYITQPDGRKTFSSILIEIKDQQVYLKNGDASKAEYFMIVDHWEIVRN